MVTFALSSTLYALVKRDKPEYTTLTRVFIHYLKIEPLPILYYVYIMYIMYYDLQIVSVYFETLSGFSARALQISKI